MRGKIIKDWSRVQYSRKTGMPIPGDMQKIMGSLERFMKLPHEKKDVIRAELAKVQEFSTPEDFPTSVLGVLEKYHLTNAYDMGYQQIFDINDFTGSDRNGFKILDVQSALSFSKVAEGAKAKVYQMSGTDVTVEFDYYGAALGWHRRLFEDKEFWALEDNAIEFRNKAFETQAAAYYALIEAITSARNITWQAPDPSALASTDPTYTASRDANTINAAALNIIAAVKDKGYGINPQSVTFVILVPLALRARIRRSLTLLLQPLAGSGAQVDFDFSIVPTTMLASSSSYYVCLPKRKLKGGTRMNLRIFSAFDQLSYTDTSAGWMRFGGAIGDQEQLARCAIA